MHKRFLAKEQIRIHTLTVVFGAWSAQIQCVRAQRREQDRLSAEFHQMTRLRCSFQHWRLTLRGCQRRQEKVQAIARMAAWHWRQTVQKRKLEAAGSRARRVLDRRRRAVAFKTWCDVKASSDAERGKVKILRHLLDLRKLQAAFATWRRAWSERRRAQLVLEGAQRRSLQRCFEAWRSVLQQKSISVSYRDKLQRQVVELCFQGWRRSLELFHRRKMFVIHLFEERRWRARETVREYKKQEDQARGKVTFNYSLEDLLLQQTFHKWIEERCKLQRAREFTEVQEQKRIRAIVRQWHKLAEQAVHERVQRFSARLEQLGSGEPRSHTERSRTSGGFQGPGPACHSLDTTVGSQQQVIMERDRGLGDRQLSLVDIDDRETDPIRLAGAPGQADEESSPQASSLLCSHTAGMDGTDRLDHTAHICTLGLSQQSAVSHKGPKRLKVLVRSAVITIMHRSMSTAFFQWRKYTLMGRDERSQIDHFIDRRSRSVLSWAIGMWKTEATHQISAKKCWETRLLTSSVALWKGFVLQQKCEGVLQKKAVEFCSTHLLTLSFTMWKRKRRLKIIPRNAEEDLQLERRAHWLRRTVQRVRLRRMFTLWAARVRQSHKVQLYHTRALQTRVFVAWGRWVKEDRERKARAEGSCQLHCYRLRFSMWRASLAQRLDIKRKAAERSEQCARTALLRWHSYTRNKCQLQRLLSNSLQNQNRTVKIRILLIWTNATHNMKRADTFSQQSLKNRCLQRWHIAAVRAKGIQSQLKAFQIGKTEREMRRAFSQWKKHYCLNQEEVQQRERRTQCLVRRAALRWRRTVVLRRAVTQQTRKQLGYALKRWRLALAGRQAAYTRVRPVAKAWLRHTQQSRARQQRVGVFHRESQRCCLAACLGAWVFAYQFSVTSKGFWARGQCRRMLRAWHDVTLATQMHREQVVSFLTNTRQGIVALCFAQWRSQLWQVQQRYRTLELRLSDQQKSLKATVMHSWILATRGRQVLKLHHRAELKQWFNQWKGRTESSKLAEQFFTEKESRRLRLVLVYWLSWVKETKERQLRSEAVSMCVRHRTVSHVFHVWVRAKRRQAEALRLNCIHLLHRAFLGWQIAVQGHRRFSADVNRKLCTLRMQAAFNTWRKQLESLQTLQIQAEQTTQKQEQRVLRSALRTWRHKVQSLKYRTAYLSKKYCSRWIQVVFTNHTNKTTLKRTQAEDLYKTRLCGTFLRKWRNVALLQRFHRSRHRRSTKLLWDRWKNHAAATLFTRNMYERRLLEKAWITWRKRRIQTRVSMAFAVQQDRVLVRVVFSAWREHLRRLKEDASDRGGVA
ncbi:uncharacterized protein LOC136713933 isoform X2 [Amia ocellicauda]|uniref:uncharacterized protein LOC136713933 isoform X2 n=1 Tax=Amia ocellicauda TaxID=2972642 RepID=UPI0034643711